MRRRGFTKIEMLVSATLLTTMIAIATPLLARLNQVWHSTRLYQLASQELMNHMDVMMQLSPDECSAKLSALKVSSEIKSVMPEAELNGRMDSTSDGNRIVLSFQLPASVRAEPIVLIGWLNGGVSR